ncbi:hypothetical protein FACS189454_04560 [Planctomycetales bacterium]|nr:hypothetical protein FACS189454_04560 [Planctomycetales bacterium]
MTSSQQKRELISLLAAGIIFILVAVPLVMSLFGSEMSNLQKKHQKLQADITELKNKVKNEAEIKKRLTDLSNQSLPTRDQYAQSLYSNWLMQLANEVGIKEYKSDAGSMSPTKNLYKKFSYTLHGRGTLEQLAEFLRRFGKMNYLHLVRGVTPKPIKNSNEFELTIKVEALSLPQSQNVQELPKIETAAIAATDDDKKMLKMITDRAIFTEYHPPQIAASPQEPARPKPIDFDSSPFCFVTTIVEADGKYQCWINNRIEGKTYKLNEGGMFSLGGVRVFVKKIEFDRVHFEAVGEFYTVRIGKSFFEFE